MINLNDFRKNIYHNYGVKECPHYSEDGVIKKIFSEIGVESKPFAIEFGETRSLGTTTRAFRIGYLARAVYFVGNIDFYSKFLNIFDVLKTTLLTRNIKCLKFLTNMPFVFFVTPENIVDFFNNLIKKEGITKNSIDLLTIDIDSYDYYCVKELLVHKYKPRVFVVEYNPNLPINEALSYPNLKSPSNIPKNKKVTYDIIRKNKVIGTHQIEFIENEDTLLVKTNINIKVTVLFVTAYKFSHQSTETWSNEDFIGPNSE